MDFSSHVRATLLYFDLFEYPLTAAELFRFMPVRLDLDDFMQRLNEAKIKSSNGFYQLDSHIDLSLIRQRREKKAKAMLASAKIVGAIIRHFPFVRGAFLSGSLSKGVNEGDADIDLFLVTAEQRLWVCRSMLTMFKKLFLLNTKKFLCPNYFVTETHLEIPEKNIFTATEVVTLKPLFNEAMLSKFIQANHWISEFYPNFKHDLSRPSVHPSIIQKAFELPMSDGYTEGLDRKLMAYYRLVWKKRYPGFTDSEREFLFRTTPYSSKVHPKDYQTKVLSAYEERLERENLRRLTRLDG